MLKFGNIVGMDKLAFDLSNSAIPNLELNGGKLWVDEDTGEVRFKKGEMDKIQIRQFHDYTSFELNPAIYMYENNFYTVSYSEFVRMIAEIEARLNFSIGKGIMRKLHPQGTIQVDANPKGYFDVLGNSPNFHRSEEKTTLYYKTGGKKDYKTNLFYDKKIKSKKDTPKEFRNGEYLRFENQLYNDCINYVAGKIGKKNILIEDLLNPKIYQLFVDLWYEEYLNITKEKEYIFDLSKIQKPSDIDKLLINMGLGSLGGLTEFEKILNASKPYIDRKSDFFSKVRSRYKKIANTPYITIESPRLDELNSKMEEVYRNTLQDIQKS